MANTIEIEGVGRVEIEGFDKMTPEQQAKAVDEIAGMHKKGNINDWADTQLAGAVGGIIGGPRTLLEAGQAGENVANRAVPGLTRMAESMGYTVPKTEPTVAEQFGVKPSGLDLVNKLPKPEDVKSRILEKYQSKDTPTPGWAGRNIVDPAIQGALSAPVSGPIALMGAGAGIASNALPQAPGIAGDPDLEKLAGLAGIGVGALGPAAVRGAGRATGRAIDKNFGYKSLDDEAASQLSKRIEQRANDIAGTPGDELSKKGEKIVRTVNKNKSESADQIFDSVRGDINKEILALKQSLRDEIHPSRAVDFDNLTTRMAATNAAEVNKRIHQTASAADIGVLEDIVGGTREGSKLITLIKEQNELSNLRRQGLKGGFSQYTDLISPFSKNRMSLGLGMVGAHMAAGPYGAATVAGIPFAGRIVDYATGQRSRMSTLLKKYSAKDAAPEVDTSLPSYIEGKKALDESIRLGKEAAAAEAKAERARVKADKEGAKLAKAEAVELRKQELEAKRIYEKEQKLLNDLRHGFLNTRANKIEIRAGNMLMKREAAARRAQEKMAGLAEEADTAVKEAAIEKTAVDTDIQARKDYTKMRMQEMNEDRLPAMKGAGYNRLIYDETGVRPKELLKAVPLLKKTGNISKPDYTSFFTDPKALKEHARGALILEKIRKLADEGKVARDPNWTPSEGQYAAPSGKDQSYGTQVQASQNLADIMMKNAPNADIAAAAAEIAATKGRKAKRALMQAVIDRNPNLKPYIDRFKALTEFGPEDY